MFNFFRIGNLQGIAISKPWAASVYSGQVNFVLCRRRVATQFIVDEKYWLIGNIWDDYNYQYVPNINIDDIIDDFPTGIIGSGTVHSIGKASQVLNGEQKEKVIYQDGMGDSGYMYDFSKYKYAIVFRDIGLVDDISQVSIATRSNTPVYAKIPKNII